MPLKVLRNWEAHHSGDISGRSVGAMPQNHSMPNVEELCSNPKQVNGPGPVPVLLKAASRES